MSIEASTFVTMARDSRITDRPPKVMYQGQTTFTKICLACGFHTPHAYINGKWQCVICDPSENGDDHKNQNGGMS